PGRQQSQGSEQQMNLATHAPIWLLAILFAAFAAAAIEDFIRLKISNVICLTVLVAALVAMTLQGFSLDLWQNAIAFLALLVAGMPLFAAGKMGGGDVKLLACAGLWVNISDGLWLLASSLIAGGILAIIYIVVRVSRGGAFRKRNESKGIPYGIAIAAG